MGDLDAVDVASRVREGFLEPVGLLDPIAKLEFGKKVPVSKYWHGLYIDDFLSLGVVDRANARSPGKDTLHAEQASLIYEELGGPESKDKAFTGDLNFNGWGAEVRGGASTVLALLASQQQTFTIIGAVVALGWSSGLVLQ